MLDVLLSTKLYIPQASQNLVHRPRLVEQMEAGLRHDDGGFARKLTLVSAPAGYGKTTLITEWLAEISAGDSAPDFAWLSLEEADNNPPPIPELPNCCFAADRSGYRGRASAYLRDRGRLSDRALVDQTGK
jgi:hypothetical protein